MNIRFRPLTKSDFPILLVWLETAHVKTWWDSSVTWTLDKVTEKYTPYVAGYKRVNHQKKPIHAFIILLDDKPIGYIQYYNAQDFLDAETLCLVHEKSLGALDFYLGAKALLGQNLGQKILRQFLSEVAFKTFDTMMVVTDCLNRHAIRAYTQAGFSPAHRLEPKNELLMMVKKGPFAAVH